MTLLRSSDDQDHKQFFKRWEHLTGSKSWRSWLLVIERCRQWRRLITKLLLLRGEEKTVAIEMTEHRNIQSFWSTCHYLLQVSYPFHTRIDFLTTPLLIFSLCFRTSYWNNVFFYLKTFIRSLLFSKAYSLLILCFVSRWLMSYFGLNEHSKLPIGFLLWISGFVVKRLWLLVLCLMSTSSKKPRIRKEIINKKWYHRFLSGVVIQQHVQ